MRFELHIECKNAAFWDESDNPSYEVARILRELSGRIEGHPHFSAGHSQPVSDANGNEVGCFTVVGKPNSEED